MKNNILSKLSFVFVAIFSFVTFNGLVKADTELNITNASELIIAIADVQSGSGAYVLNIQNDITVNSEIYLSRYELDLTINGNGHTITGTQSSNTSTSIGYVLSVRNAHQININDLNFVVGNGFRSGILSENRSTVVLKNVNITMAQTTAPKKNGADRTGSPLVINNSTVKLEGNNSVVANQYSWAAVDLTNSNLSAIFEIGENATLNITDNRTDETKITKGEPVVKLSNENSNNEIKVVNPERANLAMNPDNGHYYLRLNEVRITMEDIKVGKAIPSSVALTVLPSGSLKMNTIPITCFVSDTDKGTAPTDEEEATGIFEDGKYYYCNPANIYAAINESYIVGEFTKFYVNGEKINYPDYFEQWIKTAYTYEVKEEDSLSFDKGKIDALVLTIDGDYSLFESIKIGDLKLEKDTDYTVTAGSTIITFTEEGLAKLNKLAKGEYDVEVKYTNGKTVTTTLTIEEIVNPKTGVSAPYIVLGVVVLIGIISLIVVKKKYNN